MRSSHYDKEFFDRNLRNSMRSGKVILTQLLDIIPGTKSAVDVGCGTGAWLSILKEEGVETIQGYDGDWVLDAEALIIPRECFQPVDLNQPLEAARRFDLAISVEVAEHLEPEQSVTLVRSLTRLSDVVLFSAALPGQGGTNHINEQWPSYWAELFRAEGHEVVDVLRGRIWEDDRVSFWYRQNILLFLNQNTKADLIESLRRESRPPLRIIHPELYSIKNRFRAPNIMDADLSATKAFILFSYRLKIAIQRMLSSRKA